MEIAFTHCSNSFLAQAKTMIRSLARHEPAFKLYLFLVAEKSPGVDYRIDNTEVVIVNEKVIPGIEEMILRYSITELMSSVKPMLFQYLMRQNPEATTIIYLDADI